MIKLGQLAKHAMDKEFPNNWKSIAIMLNVPFTMYNDKEEDLPEDKAIEIEFSDTITLTISANGSIATTASIPKEMIAQMIVELANEAKQAKP